MKTAGIILASALVSAAVSIGSYQYLNKNTNEKLVSEENYKVKLANFPMGASAAPTDFVQAAAVVTPAVVHIRTTYSSDSRPRNPFEQLFGSPMPETIARASGSGVLISADGYIVTNNHVVENATDIQVSLQDKRSFTAKLIGRDPSTDLALIKVQGSNLPVVELGNSDEVQVGEWVLAFGFPLSLNSTVTAGIISAKGRSIGIIGQASGENSAESQDASAAIESFIQTDAAINPGNSGGALVNASGQLIGINSAIASQTGSYAGYGFAIPVNLAKKVINDLRSFGKVKRGYLGVSFPAPSAEEQLFKQQGITPGSVKGVYITGVQPGSAAASAGIKTGDIIQSIDGTRLSSSAEFSERIARHRPGDKVELGYLRNGKTTNTKVTLRDQQSAAVAENNNGSSSFRNKLGVELGPLPGSVKQYYGLNSGLLVTAVNSGGFFEQAGIPKNTVIIQVNGRQVNSISDFEEALTSSRNSLARIEGIMPDGLRFIVNFPLGA